MAIQGKQAVIRIKPLILWVFAAMLALAGALSAGGWYYRHHKALLRERAWRDLNAIADLKVTQISQWRSWRLSEGRFLAALPALRRSSADLIMNRRRQGNLAEEVLMAFRDQTGSEFVALADRNGQVKWSTRPLAPSFALGTLGAIDNAVTSGNVVLSDFDRDANHAWLDLVAPVVDPLSQKAVGAIVVRLDPSKQLYPLIQTWPTPSATGETLIVRREGERTLFLNELRHRKGTALRFSLPMNRETLPAAVAAQGREVTMEGIDYRDVPVLAVTHRIPDSSWAMVAKIDKSESYAEINRLSWVTALQVVLLVSTFGLAAALLIYRSITEMRVRHQAAETEKLLLSQRLDYLSKYANDIILMFNEELRVIEANDRALEMYGYERDQLIGMQLADLYPANRRPEVEADIGRLRRDGRLLQEAVHVRNDGREFSVEASMRLIHMRGRVYCQAIVRDITERKRHQDLLMKSRAELEKRVEERTAQLRRFATHLEKMREDDAKRISEEIHEDLGSMLAAVRFDVTWTRDRLRSTPLRLEQSRLETAAGLLDRVLNGVRRISQALRPFVLDHLGLRAALETLAEEIQARDQIKCRMRLGFPDVNSNEWSIAVYRLVEQAITTAGLRAGTTAVDVSLRASSGEARLIVTDDGSFEDEAAGVENWGVLSMKEAVRRLGGECVIAATGQRGVRFEAWFRFDSELVPQDVVPPSGPKRMRQKGPNPADH